LGAGCARGGGGWGRELFYPTPAECETMLALEHQSHNECY